MIKIMAVMATSSRRYGWHTGFFSNLPAFAGFFLPRPSFTVLDLGSKGFKVPHGDLSTIEPDDADILKPPEIARHQLADGPDLRCQFLVG